MTKASINQFSFNRGEIDPVLHGRSDWKYYFSGAAGICNMVTRTQGGATKRGGLRLVARALSDDTPSHLVPFRFSVRQSYMLEFGDYRMRIIKDGGVVTYPSGHSLAGREVAIATPYPARLLPEVRYAQSADIMIMTHHDYPPQRLSRHDHHDWRFENLFSHARTPAPANLRITDSGGNGARYVVTATGSKGESPPGAVVTAVTDKEIAYNTAGEKFSAMYVWLRQRNPDYIPTNLHFHAMTTSDLVYFLKMLGYVDVGAGLVPTDSGKTWRIRNKNKAVKTISWRNDDLSPLVAECLEAADCEERVPVAEQLAAAVARYVGDANASFTGSPDNTLIWSAVGGAQKYCIYRETAGDNGKEFRLVGEATGTTFADKNLSVQAETLPAETERFFGVDAYPGVCAFFEQRLVLGRSNKQPTTFWGSDTGVYNQFGSHTPIEDTDSYDFTLASGEMNEIHWIVPLNDMLLGTSGGEWKAGGGGNAITPSNINARVQSWYGCAELNPVVVGRSVVFAGRSRRVVRNFTYSLEADGYAGRDLTAYAGHLFVTGRVAAMCHQQEPAGILWLVMADGGLLSCTFTPEEDVVAWSRHRTAGRFEACGALVDADGGDQVYFCVSRNIGGQTRRFIETLEDAADSVNDVAEGFFVDCGLTYRGVATNRVTGLDHLEGETVVCLADGNVYTDLTVKAGGIDLPNAMRAGVIHVGLPYRSELSTLELEPDGEGTLRNRPRFAVAAVVRLLNSRDCLYSHTGGGESELRFRTNELPGSAIRLFTGDKSVLFSCPAGARTAKLTFASETPTPLTILGVAVEVSCGQPA